MRHDVLPARPAPADRRAGRASITPSASTTSRRCGWASPTSRPRAPARRRRARSPATPSSQLTTAQPGDYFDNGAIQNLSHVILDLEAFYARAGEAGSAEDETYLERVQYMFRSDPPPSFGGGGDPFLNGGGPAFLPSTFAGTGDAGARGAQGVEHPAHRAPHRPPVAHCSSRPERRTARRCTSGWTDLASTPGRAGHDRPPRPERQRAEAALHAPSCRRPTSSTRCGATRPR